MFSSEYVITSQVLDKTEKNQTCLQLIYLHGSQLGIL